VFEAGESTQGPDVLARQSSKGRVQARATAEAGQSGTQTWSTASHITQIDALVHVLRRRAYQADQPL
jgi:hypothetical protein